MFRLSKALSALFLLMAVESSCRKRTAAIPVPPPPAAAPAETRPSTPPSDTGPVVVPHPVQSVDDEPAYQVNKPPGQVGPPLPPPQTQPTRKAGPASSQPQNAPPRLGDILTREQERQYNAAIDQSLARAQNSLNAIASRQLTKEQKAVVAQIQSFVQQAQTTRKSSLSGARSLAERAEVLARDLAGSLH